MSLVDEAMTDFWGERCEQFDPECPTCVAWAELEMLRMIKRDFLTVSASDSDEVASLQALYASENENRK